MTASDADRAKAADLVHALVDGSSPHPDLGTAIADALASERAAAVADLRARVEALAEELAGDDGWMYCAEAAARLRAAVTDTTGGTR